MINLKEALLLTESNKGECLVWIRKKDDELYNRKPFTVNELIKKFDLKNITVYAIRPCFLSGDYMGFEFIVNIEDI